MGQTPLRIVNEPHPLQDKLSERLRAMLQSLSNVADLGTGMTRDDLETLIGNLKAMTADARTLEGSPETIACNAAALYAIDRLTLAESAILATKSALQAQLQRPRLDPTGDCFRWVDAAAEHLDAVSGLLSRKDDEAAK